MIQEDLIQAQEEIVPSQPKSIFARFKTYNNIDEKPLSSSAAANTNAANAANSNAEVKKNQFKYKGKIADAYLKDACAYSSATDESVRGASQTDESGAQETGAQGQESGAQESISHAKSLQEPKIDYLSFKKQYILNKI